MPVAKRLKAVCSHVLYGCQLLLWIHCEMVLGMVCIRQVIYLCDETTVFVLTACYQTARLLRQMLFSIFCYFIQKRISIIATMIMRAKPTAKRDSWGRTQRMVPSPAE